MDSTLGSIVATITIGFIYFMFRRKSQPIFKKNKHIKYHTIFFVTKYFYKF